MNQKSLYPTLYQILLKAKNNLFKNQNQNQNKNANQRKPNKQIHHKNKVNLREMES